jgi:hypothetical protein
MDSRDLTCDQCRQMHRALFSLANYLHGVVQRMERRGFPPDDALYVKAKCAYDGVRSLYGELHHLSCRTGVGRPPRE